MRPFHEVAVRDDRVDVVVEDRELRSVHTRRQVAGRNGHAYAVAEALAQGRSSPRRPGIAALGNGRRSCFPIAGTASARPAVRSYPVRWKQGIQEH